jgi:hypothetical protein
MLPSGIRIWQPEFPTKILSRKTGAVQYPKREKSGVPWKPVLKSFSSSSTRS